MRSMWKCFVWMLVMGFFMQSSFAGLISPELQSIVNKLDSQQELKVIVIMKDRPKLKGLHSTPSKVNSYLKKFAKESQQDIIKFLHSKSAGNVKYKVLYIINAIALKANKRLINMLAKRPDVQKIIYDETVALPPVIESKEPPQTSSDSEWNISIVRADKVRKLYGLDGSGVVVGHIDTGCDANHPDLKGKVIRFKDFVNNKTEPYDDQGHGTHTCGTIAGGNASGKYIGIAPGAKLIVAKVFSSSGSAQSSDIMDAMQWMLDPDGDPATNDAPKLVSNSWGSSSQTNTTYWDAVEAWRAAGIFPCFAAGNSGPSSSTVGTPGGFPHAFAVGATDINDKIAYFSSRGPIKWNGKIYIKPEVSAPGKNINSAKPGGGYRVNSGTSMACPNVAGIIALIYQANPDISISEIWDVLEATAKDLGESGKDNTFGSGRVDAFAAIQRLLDSGKVKGKIVDNQTGKSIKGARVAIVAQDVITYTDKNGKYVVTLPKGTYKFEFSAFSYISQTATIVVKKGEEKEFNVSLQKAAEGEIIGVVKNEEGLPLAAKIKALNTPIPEVSTNPANGEFKLKLPEGIYSVRVSAFGYETEVRNNINVSGTVTENFSLKKLPPVLLVDDDEGKKFESYYKKALDANSIKYTYYQVTKGSTGPDKEILLQYPVVIWFTGADYGKTILEQDKENISDYLAAGGNLFICGQDIGYDLKNDPFMKNVLHVKFLEDNAKTKVVKGVAGEIGAGLTLDISGDTSATTQKYPDVISPLDAAKTIFKYDNGKVAGIKFAQQTGRIVYLGFGVEGIKEGINRKKLVKKVVDYLMPDIKRHVEVLEGMSKKVQESSAKLVEKALFTQRFYARKVAYGIVQQIDKGNYEEFDTYCAVLENSTGDTLKSQVPVIKLLREKLNSLIIKGDIKVKEKLNRLNRIVLER